MYMHVMSAIDYVIWVFQLLFRWYWDLVMVITLGITLLVLPVEVAFYSDDEGHTSKTWMSINIIVDIIFLVDIAFNFRTGYVHTGVDQVFVNKAFLPFYKYFNIILTLDMFNK